jgi:hypothetical protein
VGFGCDVVKTGQVSRAGDTGDLPGDHLNSPGVIPVKCRTNQNRDVLTFDFFYSLSIVNTDDAGFERVIHQTCVARHPPGGTRRPTRHSPGGPPADLPGDPPGTHQHPPLTITSTPPGLPGGHP